MNIEDVTPTIEIELIRNNSKVPERAYPTDAGMDLFSTQNVTIEPLTREAVETGIVFHVPIGYVGRILPKSGLAIKSGIIIGAGVIDPNYTGEILVCMINTDRDYEFKVKEGMKIAQLVIQPILLPNLFVTRRNKDGTKSGGRLYEIKETPTIRGNNGFGSSGK